MEAIEIVLPVHNEADSIAATLEEFHRVSTSSGLDVRFRACEDGSTDGTQQVLAGLVGELPLTVDSVTYRRGYSRAVIDGLNGATAPLVGFIDSDGQCDPADLPLLLEALNEADVVFGYRHARQDSTVRKAMSRAFGLAFRALLGVSRKDASCPYLLLRRETIPVILRGEPGILPQGFWWEFSARVQAAGLRVAEVPVNHRRRAAGTTQVYLPTKVPKIAAVHLMGLVTLRRELAATAA